MELIDGEPREKWLKGAVGQVAVIAAEVHATKRAPAAVADQDCVAANGAEVSHS